jgi:hypothetical protein
MNDMAEYGEECIANPVIYRDFQKYSTTSDVVFLFFYSSHAGADYIDCTDDWQVAHHFMNFTNRHLGITDVYCEVRRKEEYQAVDIEECNIAVWADYAEQMYFNVENNSYSVKLMNKEIVFNKEVMPKWIYDNLDIIQKKYPSVKISAA